MTVNVRICTSERRKRAKRILANRWLYLMMVPGILYFILFKYLPMYGVVIAFKTYSFSKGILGSPWVGLKYFEMFFTSYDFSMIMRNTVLISLYKMLFGFPAPILLALMINELTQRRFKRVVQTLTYLPHFISWVVVGNLVFVLFAPTSGAFSKLWKDITGETLRIMSSPQSFRSLLVITDVWKSVGFGSIIYLAAISGIDPTLYEAATIDGASTIRQVRSITLPSIMPVIIIMLILRTGYILDAGFEQIFIMQNSMVRRVSEIIDTYVYKVGLVQSDYSYSTAVGLFKSLIGMTLVIAVNTFAKKVGEEGLW